jgi:hypothetical protein
VGTAVTKASRGLRPTCPSMAGEYRPHRDLRSHVCLVFQ